MSDPTSGIRLDKWLWHARFFKTRSLAARVVTGGHVRVNGTRVSKPAATIRPGDALTFPQGNRIRVVVVLAPGQRRGPAPEAQALYQDRTPEPTPTPPSARITPGEKPDKRARRAHDRLRRFTP